MRIPVRKRYAKLIKLVKKLQAGARRWDRQVKGLTIEEMEAGGVSRAEGSALLDLSFRYEQLCLFAAQPVDRWTLRSIAPVLQMDSQGQLRRTFDFTLDEFIPALTDKNCDIRRLKICPICSKGSIRDGGWQTLFVALREDQDACSPRCGGVLRQQRFRAKKAQYKENAERNRAAKEARKNGRTSL